MDTPDTWSVVMPVKALTAAKSRLADLGPGPRSALAHAFLVDSLAAVLACPAVSRASVVTDDRDVADLAARAGADVVTERPGSGLNAAVAYGASVAAARGELRVAALVADLPSLTAVDLATALRAAAHHHHAFVPDAAGTGTTLLAATGPAGLAPRFGPGSAAAHASLGATNLSRVVHAALATLRRDVDTLADLRAAIALGAGTATTSWLDRWGALAEQAAG